MSEPPTVIVLAKAPRPGRSKTRLCPPCTPTQAARLAAAALCDTLDVVDAVPARRVLALDGPARPWARPGWTVLGQRPGGLDARIAGAFADTGGASLLVGMDTPQLTPGVLTDALARLARTDAVLGPAEDGGYWAVGLARPRADAFLGVPMSADDTGARQRARLRDLGLEVAALPTLRDVDDIADAEAVARACPGSAFAAAMADLVGEARAA